MHDRNWSFKETNVYVKSDSEQAIEAGIRAGKEARNKLERFIARHPKFRNSLEPISSEEDERPEIVEMMLEASEIVEIGPFASVAGAISQVIAEAGTEAGAKNILVDNGGDITIFGDRDFRVGIYAGESQVSGDLAFQVKEGDLPVAICTSSGSVGHSISFGEADAAVVLARTAPIADAAATAVANEVRGSEPEEAVENGIKKARSIPRIRGCLISQGDQIGTFGDLPELISLRGSNKQVRS